MANRLVFIMHILSRSTTTPSAGVNTFVPPSSLLRRPHPLCVAILSSDSQFYFPSTYVLFYLKLSLISSYLKINMLEQIGLEMFNTCPHKLFVKVPQWVSQDYYFIYLFVLLSLFPWQWHGYSVKVTQVEKKQWVLNLVVGVTKLNIKNIEATRVLKYKF